MRLYMKQKVFSIKDKFYITDENGEERYYVEGKVFSVGKKLSIQDMNQNELAFVRQKVVSLMPKFFVEINGEEVAQIVKKFSLFKPKYYIDGLGWDVKGDLFDHDYAILDNGKTIVTIHKRWMSWGDSFEMDIKEGNNEVLVLAVVLAIDAVLDSQERSVSIDVD